MLLQAADHSHRLLPRVDVRIQQLTATTILQDEYHCKPPAGIYGNGYRTGEFGLDRAEPQRLRLAVLIGIRQNFELELQSEIPGASSLPLFQFKKLLGYTLIQLEQDGLDGNLPEMHDIQHFLAMINAMHHSRDLIPVCVCNSGNRSLCAAKLPRLLGDEKSFSMARMNWPSQPSASVRLLYAGDVEAAIDEGDLAGDAAGQR